MGLTTVEEIERAIRGLTPRELAELYKWLDEEYSRSFDARIQSGLAAGNFDQAIKRALDDESKGRARPL